MQKKWKTVANLTFEHPNIREELPDPLRRTVIKEFQEYCNNATDSVLKKSRPDDLAAFSNKVLVHEADVPGGDSHMKKTGVLVGNFEFNP